MVVYREGRKPAWTSRGHAYHDTLACVMRMRTTGVSHVTRRDAEHIHDETSGIGPGPSGHRDGVCEGDTETRPLVYEDTPRQR